MSTRDLHETAPALEGPEKRRRGLYQWFTVLGPPLAWFSGLLAAYALVPLACAERTMAPLHLSALATLAVAVAGGLVSLAEWQRAGVEWPGEGPGPLGRTRFLAAIGFMSSALFSLIILAQWITKLFLNPCMGL